MIAYIPARGGSKRIPRKNIREIDGIPIIGHVIRNLAGLPFIDHICVSTDDREIADIAMQYGASIQELRKAELSDDYTGFQELIQYDVARYLPLSDEKDRFLFVLATAMLVSPAIFQQAYSEYIASAADVLMSVETFDPHPYRSLEVDSRGRIHPVYPDKIKMRTQDMAPMFVDAGCFYFLSRDAVLKNSGIWGCDIVPMILDKSVGIDIDTPGDWARLEEAYQALKKQK